VKALLDVSFLVALFDSAHVHHARAHEWLIEHRRLGWATCPLTQNGCLRIIAQPVYPGCLPLGEIARRLRLATRARDHEFWPEGWAPTDERRLDLSRIPHPRMLTDAYLLALAVSRKARLVTFDQGISLEAVPGATEDNLLRL
jgi:toxin-antitoxin system PIN domain toxin